jgi:chaperonin GroEL
VGKVYSNHSDLNEKILRGVNILADNVAATLGPKGRNVILKAKGGNPVITKDGVTVAKFIELDDPFENLGAQVIKQASQVTNANAGDGTTTATVLAREIIRQSQKYIAAGVSPVDLKRGMDMATVSIIKELGELSIPIRSREEVANVAIISANGDRNIGELVAMAIDQVGKDGGITIEAGKSMNTTLELVEGFRFDSGYISSSFVTDERTGRMRYRDPYILVVEANISSVEELLPALEQVAREGKPLVIVAENVEGQALAALIMNTVRGNMKVAAIKAPMYGEERRSILKDLALSTGATFISRETGISLKDVKLEHFGIAKSIESTKSNTIIVDGAGDADKIDRTIDLLKIEMKDTSDLHEAEKIQERITRLASGVAIIRVGGTTEIEMIEVKHRIEDALSAVRSAQEEGIVPGGGVALIRASESLDALKDSNPDIQAGLDIIRRAVFGPLKQMCLNSGESPDIIVASVKNQTEPNFGFNFSKGVYEDMIKSGVIDPAKVTKNALQNAVSAAGTLLTTNHAIVELE